MFLENCPDERIGYAGRWMNERMTGEKGFAQATHFVCVGVFSFCVRVCVCAGVEVEGWLGERRAESRLACGPAGLNDLQNFWHVEEMVEKETNLREKKSRKKKERMNIYISSEDKTIHRSCVHKKTKNVYVLILQVAKEYQI